MIDPRIPMMGQPANILGEMARGTQLAGAQNDLMRQAQMQNLFRQQGAGIMSGDTGAMNALARFDPLMATNLRTTQRENQRADTRLAMDQERLQMARNEIGRALTEAEDQAAAREEALRFQEGLKSVVGFAGSGDWQAFSMAASDLTGMEIPPGEEGLRVLGAFYEPVKKYLDMQPKQPEIPAGMQTLQLRAQAAGLVPGTPEYQAFMANGGKAPEGMRFSVNPDGTATFEQGAGVTGGMSKPFTEGQSKDNVYATRAEGALALLDSVGSEALTSRTDRAMDIAPFGITRGLQSENFQVAQQAGEEFLQAILRKDTGAAITSQEQDLYGKTYLPQPGDGPAVLEAKRLSRIRAIEALKAGMSIQQVTVTERALVQAAERAGATPASGAPATTSPPPQAVDMLRNDPSMEAMREFDEVFGEGAAAKALQR